MKRQEKERKENKGTEKEKKRKEIKSSGEIRYDQMRYFEVESREHNNALEPAYNPQCTQSRRSQL